MKKIKWPKIKKLTEPEELWLREVYETIKRNKHPDYKILRAKLYHQLPKKFNPKEIDQKLAGFNGTQITLFGIYTIDPKTTIIESGNKAINAIKELMVRDPQVQTIDLNKIAAEIGLPVIEVGVCLKLLNEYGRFAYTGGGNGYGYDSIDISRSDEVFDAYLSFTCVEDLINKHYKGQELEEERQKEFEKQYSNIRIHNQYQSLAFKPVFKSRVENIDKKLCFVLMPFKKDWSDRVYTRYIRENIEKMGLQCLRSDNLTGHIVMEDIWIKINQAAFIIADVTDKNPNVMYELGIAHTIGKPVILITQDLKNIPFDFAHLRHYEYKDNVEGKEAFEKELKRVIPEIYKENYPEVYEEDDDF